jgi:3-deoxy-manno-octulosonate cytidylyltransferase (CMP-KDO synthetase)
MKQSIEKATKKKELYNNFKVVIPARYDSARFPGKVLTEIDGKPMIQHVYEQSCKSEAAEVIVATDSKKVQEVASKFADVEMTERYHGSGTDRIREVVENRGWSDETFVINVQGDSPLINPASINQVASILEIHSDADIATLATPIETKEDFFNHNIVKVVWDSAGKALYFSRAPIPYQPEGNKVSAYRHLGIYGYTVKALREITGCGPVQLENYERLEQLRALSLGLTIKVQIAHQPHGSDVDVPADVEVVENIMFDGASER